MEVASVAMIFTSLVMFGTAPIPLQYSLLQDFFTFYMLKQVCYCMILWEFYAIAVVQLRSGMC